MKSSKVPLTKWAMAFHLMTSSKKGMSAHQLHRMNSRRLQYGLVHGASYQGSDGEH